MSLDLRSQTFARGVQLTAPQLAPRLNVGQVSIDDQGEMVLGREWSRTGSVVTNLGGATVFLGPRGVSASSGHALPSGSSLALEVSCELWGICASGLIATLSYLDQVY